MKIITAWGAQRSQRKTVKLTRITLLNQANLRLQNQRIHRS